MRGVKKQAQELEIARDDFYGVFFLRPHFFK
jgi:hypothetical protein